MAKVKENIMLLEKKVEVVENDPQKNFEYLIALRTDLTALRNKENILLHQSQGVHQCKILDVASYNMILPNFNIDVYRVLFFLSFFSVATPGMT